MRFRHRSDAGQQLAEPVCALHLTAPVILALPRGGVPVAAEVADALSTDFDVLVARKIGMPGHREYGIGAIAEGIAGCAGGRVLDAELSSRIGIDEASLHGVVEEEQLELARRVERYRGGRELPPVADRDVVVVDDGLATGVTADAAARSVRNAGARRVVIAAPVGAPESVRRLGGVADDVICVARPHDFVAVGRWYEDFAELTDEDVLALLRATLPDRRVSR